MFNNASLKLEAECHRLNPHVPFISHIRQPNQEAKAWKTRESNGQEKEHPAPDRNKNVMKLGISPSSIATVKRSFTLLGNVSRRRRYASS